MIFVDARRLTGPNLLSRRPVVVVELDLEGSDTLERAVAAYTAELGRMRVALELPAQISLTVRPHRGGAALGYPAPIDVMLACAEMSEWAAQSACLVLASQPPLPLEPKRAEIDTILGADRSPQLLALEAEARRRALPFLWDDERLTLGLGTRSFTCPRHGAPEVDAVPWDELGAIPLVLITGTNGKTTSARLMARVAREAGRLVGLSSTGGVVVGKETVEEGDWTGPAAARMVLRRPEVDFAVLETARGGILRRGLAVESADGALITNISDDHLGLYGIDDLAAMTEVKGLITHILPPSATAVLNARDPLLVSLAGRLAAKVAFFCDLETADVAARELVAARRASAGLLVLAEHGKVLLVEAGQETEVAPLSKVPLSFGGAARYNVENVLGVVALARAVGLPLEAIVRGITSFGGADNPGRGELHERRGIKVLLDFGHNPEAVRAVLGPLAELRRQGKGRLTVITGCAGDRGDKEIEDIAKAIFDARPDRVLVRELTGYLRGRQSGEVPALFHRTFRDLGYPEAAFHITTSEVEALEEVFGTGAEGDVVALLVHLDHDEVMAYLDRLV